MSMPNLSGLSLDVRIIKFFSPAFLKQTQRVSTPGVTRCRFLPLPISSMRTQSQFWPGISVMSIWSKISFACLQAIAFIVKFVFIKHHTPWFRSAGGRAVSTHIDGTSPPLQLTDRYSYFLFGAGRFSVILLFYPLALGQRGLVQSMLINTIIWTIPIYLC